MKKAEIKAVEMVRQIRDRHYQQLKDQSWEETMLFFRREAKAANAEAEQLLRQECPTTSGHA